VPEYLAPGVYVEETSFRAPSIEGVGTSTAAFVGPTLTGPVLPAGASPPTGSNPPTTLLPTPQILTSYCDFTNIYGGSDSLAIAANPSDAKNTNLLALSVKAFFENGGSLLYVQRVFTAKSNSTSLATWTPPAAPQPAPPPGGNPTPAPAPGGNPTPAPAPALSLTARFPGAWLNGKQVLARLNLTRAMKPASLPPGSLLFQPAAGTAAAVFYTNGTSTSFTAPGAGGAAATTLPTPANVYVATITVTAPNAAGGSSVYDQVGFDPNHPLYLGSVLGPTPPRLLDRLENQIAFVIPQGTSAQALFTAMFGTPADPAPPAPPSPPVAPTITTYVMAGGDDGAEPTSSDYAAALQVFEPLEDVSIVAAPGSSVFDTNFGGGSSTAEQVVTALIAHVEKPRAYRFAILDTPRNLLAQQVQSVRNQVDSSYAALYTPWIIVANPPQVQGSVSSDVAVPPSGFMAGIYARTDHQHSVAKAPANEPIQLATRFERNINFAEQGFLNPLGINCLRFFPGRGYRVWGARTASSNTEFKYVNVRRYLVYLEHSIDNGSQWAVFENNGPALWARVKESVEEFLYSEFAAGNLLGTSPSEAYHVRCDRSTMTQNDLDNGRLICIIGVALLKPAEFVIFRIGQTTADARS
jgi:phage tail sheath protein FI